jgi:hypothetical protein
MYKHKNFYFWLFTKEKEVFMQSTDASWNLQVNVN